MHRLDKMQAARTEVAKAITQGELIRQPCAVCENPRVEAHHPDYDAPLSVEWLCRLHHVRRHAEMRGPKQTDTVITFNRESFSILHWAKRVGIHPASLCRRIFLDGWPVALAITLKKPINGRLRRRISTLVRVAKECLAEVRER